MKVLFWAAYMPGLGVRIISVTVAVVDEQRCGSIRECVLTLAPVTPKTREDPTRHSAGSNRSGRGGNETTEVYDQMDH